MAAHRNRLRVRVRSFVTGAVLRYVSEHEARVMIAQNADGSEKLGEDGKPLEAVARRLSRLKAPLTDIKLFAPERQERQSNGTIPRRAIENNAFMHDGVRLTAKDSIQVLDADVALIKAWPEIHDDRNVVISAGKAFGVTRVQIQDRYLNFG